MSVDAELAAPFGTITGLIRLRTALPEQAELFGVIENAKQRVPLGTVPVAAAPP